ncbi:MAG TPA: lipocalin-like domain-containing protein [Casimicrobiaceae bacterium]|nr:lipocalin-like domain-containing protein [Casimicrobiaceae bacterium]
MTSFGAPDFTRRRVLSLPLLLSPIAAQANVVYPRVIAGTKLQFPRDEGAHPDFRSEWWYVTGWLRDARQRESGFQVTFFRNRPGVAEASPSRFAAKQLLFAHAAIADPARQRLVFDQRAAREGFRLAEAAVGRTDVHIGDWSFAQHDDRYIANVRAREFTFDLTMQVRQPILLQGEGGVSRKGPDPADASYYYSRPHLAVSGTLALDDRSSDVNGVAWLDHEWSSRYLPRGAVGWDWTGIDFDDGGALMAFRIRDASSNPLWAAGALRDAHGETRIFSPTDIEFSPLRRWRSPRTGIDYPIAYRVRATDLVVALEPMFADQELDARAGVGTIYWEGAVRASRDGRVVGRGYLELTGYGEPLRI